MEGGGMVTPGFRFYPTEEELISFYLKRKIEEDSNSSRVQQIDCVIPQLRVYDFYPWDLPQYAGELCHGDPEQWFFFIPRQEKEARGGRPCRLTSSGYWKATGSPSIVYSSSNRRIGVKRTMVFYCGRAPNGEKTKWKMNEYKAFQEEASSSTNPKPKLMDELSLCRVYVKSTCLRAFDRRPSGVAIREPDPVQQTLRNDHHATTSSHLDHPLMTRTTTTSSYDHSRGSLEDQTTNNFQNTTDNQPLWNWEELHHWFQN